MLVEAMPEESCHARAARKGAHLAKPNYAFEKRQRDLAKKQKQEEKRRQKLADKAAAEGGGQELVEEPSGEAPPSPGGGAVISPDEASKPES
jgi:hypothetical protein